VTVTAIVLAGGRSSRFGEDKLAAHLDGGSVLQATIDAVSPIADGVIVAGPRLPDGFVGGDLPVAIVRDVEPFDGPLAALANVLASGTFDRGDLGVVVGGDMPRLAAPVLAAMLDVLDQDASVDAVYLGAGAATDAPPRRRQVLPLAIRLQPSATAAREAVGSGERSLQAFLDRLPHVELPSRRWLALDPDALTLTDVDTRGDLDRLNAT
jgi:molybdenum cofactor guanylyltransferase